MGIAPYKTFTFDGESSGDYGVYITGTGVFNAPERSVEMVEIAGRNGSFALDKGKFENIEVTYKVGIVDDSEADFADRVSDFRNWLCSKVGYCRLEDEYNPNEYRMAVYASGVEIDHDLLIAGEAEITFNCKPQRWLTSGETAVSVADGGTIDNPTLFESEPLLAVEGYGNIAFNGYSIDIENAVLGNISLDPETIISPITYSGTTTATREFNGNMVNNGDQFALLSSSEFFYLDFSPPVTINSFTVTKTDNNFITITETPSGYPYRRKVTTASEALIFSVGTPATYGNTTTASFTVTQGTSKSGTYTRTIQIDYDGQHTITITITSVLTNNNNADVFPLSGNYKSGEVVANSTVSTLGNPTYIDCDLGECYMVDSDDNIISLNGVIDLGSDLPRLVSGTNTINYDNTITDLKVTPRWWKV